MLDLVLNSVTLKLDPSSVVEVGAFGEFRLILCGNRVVPGRRVLAHADLDPSNKQPTV